MIESVKMQLPMADIESFCKRWRIDELDLFGSVIREDFRPDSDVDVLVTFSPESRWSLFDLARMQNELAVLLGRQVDLVERKAVEHSENYIRRKHILTNLAPIYVAG